MTESEKQAIASRFTAFREKHVQLLQKELAKEADVHLQTISRIETGQNLPNQKIVTFLAQKYGLNPNWLMTGKGVEKITAKANKTSEANMLARIALLENELKDVKSILNKLLEKLG